MSYSLSWYSPDKVICLRLNGQPELDQLKEINQKVEEMLQQSDSQLTLIVDASKMKAGYHTSNWLRDTQTYMYDSKVKQVFWVSENKLNRLISLMAFSLSNARLTQFDKWQLAIDQLKRQGLASIVVSSKKK